MPRPLERAQGVAGDPIDLSRPQLAVVSQCRAERPDVLQIDDDYEFHGPEYWKWPPGRLDHWGVSPPHTARWKRVQHLYPFADDAYRLHRS